MVDSAYVPLSLCMQKVDPAPDGPLGVPCATGIGMVWVQDMDLP